MDSNGLHNSSRKILQLSITQVVPGMVTARDIYSKNGQLILTKDIKLSPNMIAKILYYAISTIYVYDWETDTQGISYYQKVQNSDDFIHFQKIYQEVLTEISTSVKEMIEGKKPIKQEHLVESVKSILERKPSRYHVMELIYCIREFDEMTFAHSINVALICNIFGEWLHMSEEEKDILTVCGLMHDIGKVAIPKEILEKPTKLSKEEYEIIKLHPEKGYLMLLGQKVDPRIRLSTLQHHERFDGKGYPLGKQGEHIEPFAMIVAIADVFDAMTSKRVYRNEICPFQVLDMFEHDGKQQYDIKVLLPLIERIAEIYINHSVLLSDNSRGEVIMINKHALSKPVVRIKNTFIDLSKHKDLTIQAVI